MRPPSRTRRIFKWTGAALSLLILATWIATQWFWVQFPVTPRTLIVLGTGQVGTSSLTKDRTSSGKNPDYFKQIQMGYIGYLSTGWQPPWTTREIKYHPGDHRNFQFHLALWFVFLITAVPTAWLWHRDRRTERR